jgi:hypothetical protein
MKLRLRLIIELIEAAAALVTIAALFFFLFIIFLALTPNQSSGEADWCRVQMETERN